MNRQVEIKAEQIARLIIKGVTKARIAIEMGMSYDGLMRITRCQEYLCIEERVRNENLGRLDARLAQRATLNDELEEAVPEAMAVLLEKVKAKRDLRAALEVLDRDPQRQFAKQSKNAAPTDPTSPIVNPEAFASAVKDADITHTLMQTASKTKPAEA